MSFKSNITPLSIFNVFKAQKITFVDFYQEKKIEGILYYLDVAFTKIYNFYVWWKKYWLFPFSKFAIIDYYEERCLKIKIFFFVARFYNF